MAQSNSQTYLLKILEIPGKSVTQQYIAVVKDKLDKLGLKHSINIVVDENLVRNMPQLNGQSGGGEGSTFPFNVFEGALDKILRRQTDEQPQEKGWISNAYDKLKGYNQKRQGLIDRLFSYTPLDEVPDVKRVEPAVPIEPSEAIEQADVIEPDEPTQLVEPIEPDEPIEYEEPIDRAETIETVEQSADVIATNIEFPQNYSGVLYIQITIYEQPNGNSDITYGIHELNQMIMV
jgi:hypothetical protein